MPGILSQEQQLSRYNQTSFIGGMNLSLDDTRLGTNQYRIGFNLRNRYDRMDPILSSKLDTPAPAGVIQELTTFGNYEILFAGGRALYKLYTDTTWRPIQGFHMSESAPRYWTKAIPVSTTNYLRIAASVTIGAGTFASQSQPINVNNIAGAAAGNLPGLLVQDNLNQPQFIFLDVNGIPTTRITQTFGQWQIQFTDGTNTIVGPTGGPGNSAFDLREYVPIGNVMEYVDGVLYIASPDGNSIYCSVSGRPLDFVRNVTNVLATLSSGAYTMKGGGDATTTAYSVGVGPINTLKAMSDGSLFVGAGNANFNVSKNMTPNAPTIFGEYQFIRRFLFNANCLSDRAIFDSLGDTRFIDLTGVRSFNAIAQLQNEGRNSVFTNSIQGAFVQTKGATFITNIVQNPSFAAGILYDNYELYAVNTVFGPAIVVYDTINNCWVGCDLNQVNGKRIKILTKIELAVQALFAVTEDDKIYRLYVGPGNDTPSFRTPGICSGLLWAGSQVKMADPKMEVKLVKTRVILNNITQNCALTFTPYVDNRIDKSGSQTKNITFVASNNPTTGPMALSDVDTMLKNELFPTPDCNQGWKVFGVFSWTNGSITQYAMELVDKTPAGPSLNAQ